MIGMRSLGKGRAEA